MLLFEKISLSKKRKVQIIKMIDENPIRIVDIIDLIISKNIEISMKIIEKESPDTKSHLLFFIIDKLKSNKIKLYIKIIKQIIPKIR